MDLNASIQRFQISLARTFSALRHPNYRLWYIGQLVSLLGTWMQNTAQGYLIYELTQSPVYLGYVSAAAGLPSWIFMLYAGVIADRLPRRTIIIATQSVMLVLAAVLAALVFSGAVQPYHIIILALLLGIANAFDTPARVALVSELVPREDMTNAIALNSTMFNAAAFVGPAVAGLTYAWFGPGWCFTINAISFVAIIAAMTLMNLPRIEPRSRAGSMLRELGAGVNYVVHDGLTRTLIFNLSIISLFGIGLLALLPVWSVQVLGGDAQTNGLLLSARGLGSLVGALMVAALSHRNQRGKLWTTGSLLMPLAILLFSRVHWLGLSMLSLAAIGWSFMAQANTSNAMVQSRVPDDLRGRVMSVYTLFFFGGMPVGSMVAGFLAERLGAPQTALICGLILLCVAIFFWFRLPGIRKLE